VELALLSPERVARLRAAAREEEEEDDVEEDAPAWVRAARNLSLQMRADQQRYGRKLTSDVFNEWCVTARLATLAVGSALEIASIDNADLPRAFRLDMGRAVAALREASEGVHAKLNHAYMRFKEAVRAAIEALDVFAESDVPREPVQQRLRFAAKAAREVGEVDAGGE